MDGKLDASLIDCLKSKGSGTVAIFDRGDFFSVYREDAILLASDVFRSDVCLKTVTLSDAEKSSLSYLTMNVGQYQRVVRELLMILRYRVELYVVEGNSWLLKAKGTVGNMGDFEDIVGDVADSSIIMSIHFSSKDVVNSDRISLCFWDTMELRITTTEFGDNAILSHVEQCILGMNPKECVVFPSGSGDQRKKLSSLLKRLHVMETPFKERVVSDWDSVLSLFPSNSVSSEKFSEITILSLCGLYDYLKISDQSGFSKKFQLSDYGTSGYMHIDAAAVSALELFDLSYYKDSLATGTLFNMLNKCRTAAGQRLLRDWLARPLCELRQILERQDVISALLENVECRSTLYEALLPRVPDVFQLSRKLIQGKAKLQDCYRIYQLILLLYRFEKTTRKLFESKNDTSSSVKELMLEPICYSIAQFERFIQLIRSTVDVDYFEKSGTFRIKPDIDPGLLEIAEEMETLERKCERARSEVSSYLGLDSVKLESNAQHGFVFRVTLKDERNLRQNKKITILETNKGSGIRFTDRALSDLSERYKDLNNIYQTAQSELEMKVVETCAGYSASLSQVTSSLATIDVLVALAVVAAQSPYGYVRPELEPMGSGVLYLEKCRHPVLEHISNRPFIPNSVDLAKDKDRFILLTGANMGGKSTYLRATALTVLMAQIGSFVPAHKARLSIVDGIYTRVGANDQQTRGISTFMAEMLDTASILQSATSNSLVIVDELGRGTSTFDGFGLAWSIASDLLKRVRSFCLFATHFHEMADICQEEGAVAMQSLVSVENGSLSLLYEVRPGVALSSFGIHVAQAVGFPQSVITEASAILEHLEEPNNIVSRLKSTKGEDLRKLILSL